MAHLNPSLTAAEALAAAIRERIRGEVRFDSVSRPLHAKNASGYRQAPLGVVIPRSIDDVIGIVDVCRRHGAPITFRGGDAGLAGPCGDSAVIIDTSKYLRGVLAIDPERRRALVEPGCAPGVLRRRAEEHRLTFGPDPSIHGHDTLGGMIGNNACGTHSIMAGRTADNVHTLDILTYDGLRLTVGPTSEDELEVIIQEGGRRADIYAGLKALRDKYAELIRARFPKIPRRVSGYALDELLPENGFNVARALVGSEGTCAVVLRAELRLVPSPANRSLLVLGYPDIYQAGDHVVELMDAGPIGLEGIDGLLVEHMTAGPAHRDPLPEGRGWLILEFGGETRDESDGKARRLMDRLRERPGVPSMKLFDDPREEARLRKLRDAAFAATVQTPGPKTARPGWEDAAVHPQDVGPYLRDYRALLDKYGYRCALYGHFGQGCIHCRIDFDLFARKDIDRWEAFLDEAADLAVRYNGSLSGGRGAGRARADLLPKMYGDALVQAFREFKAIWDPDNRMNPGKAVDAFPRDPGPRFGAGRRPPATVPPFPEPQSLFDARRGAGTTGDEAGFHQRHHQQRLRPRSAYAMRLARWWARLAACAPGLVNAAFDRFGVSEAAMILSRWMAGVKLRPRCPSVLRPRSAR
ncbi:FAD-binding oxidoreductase [Methylocaldum sp. MU1018]